jgi:hypothetical protein
MRVPGWTQNHPVPSDLYRFADSTNDRIVFKVNGKEFKPSKASGYAILDRRWKKGDVVEIELPMAVRRVLANPDLHDDNNHVSLQRGPIVFCLEGVDTKDKRVTDLVLADNSGFETEFRPDLLNGVETVSGIATPVKRTLNGGVTSEEPENFLAIPYYAWAHRGKSEMTVWVARERDAAQPAPAPTLAFNSKVSASDNRNAEAVNDQLLPKNSIDESVPFMHWWPKKGTVEWVQYDFLDSTIVSKSEIYWFDDTGVGECRLPKSCRILYLDGGEWKPVETTVPYVAEKDKNNSVQFKPVKTIALRLEVQLVLDYSAGLYEWSVE